MNSKRRILQVVVVALVVGIMGGLLALVKPSIKGGKARATEPLRALPYVTWVKPSASDKGKNGLTRHLTKKSVKGLNFFNFERHKRAHLMDMEGKLLHSWFAGKHTFDHAELLPNGDVLGIDQQGSVLFKLGWRSRIKWARKIMVHHDLAVGPNKQIYVLTEGGEDLPKFHKRQQTVENWIEVLSDKGLPQRKISFSRLLLKTKIPMVKIQQLIKKNGDPGIFDAFHTNTLELIKKDVLGADGAPLFTRGQLLTCIRNLNLIAVVDLHQEKIVWSWGMDQLERPHQPSMLPNGQILVFDNGSHREYSRVLQVDPVRKEIVWQYKASPPKNFFSNTSGGCQRLEDGSVLITESMRGRAFEVTREGQLVWEYFSPVFNKAGARKAIWRVTRLTDPAAYPVLLPFFNRAGIGGR